MAREIIDSRTAMSILREHQSRIGKPRNRIHTESMEDTANRMRALEGICGLCNGLILERTIDYLNKPSVILRCDTGYSPLKLYRKTDLGEEPICPSLRSRLS